MTTNLEKYKNDLEKLIDLGETMSFDLEGRSRLEQGILTPEEKMMLEKPNLSKIVEREYQMWYTEASSVIRQLVPDRLAEFQELYKGDGKRKETKLETYHIQDWLNGVRSGLDTTKKQKHYDDFAVVTMRFRTQHSIYRQLDHVLKAVFMIYVSLFKLICLSLNLMLQKNLLNLGFCEQLVR